MQLTPHWFGMMKVPGSWGRPGGLKERAPVVRSIVVHNPATIVVHVAPHIQGTSWFPLQLTSNYTSQSHPTFHCSLHRCLRRSLHCRSSWSPERSFFIYS